ncbi:hypothetical protein EMIT0194MI4_100220 [Pseudomonas sp. IT-194MI4]
MCLRTLKSHSIHNALFFTQTGVRTCNPPQSIAKAKTIRASASRSSRPAGTRKSSIRAVKASSLK